MYCKFCGNRINSNITKCANCGATIDFTDGGQSFFDDNELDAWKSDTSLKGSDTYIPRTKMLEIEDVAGLEKEKPASKPMLPGAMSSGKPKYKRKNEPEGLMNLFNVSNSTKIIIFCIAAVLAIVLIYATIISVLNPNSDEEETTDTSTTVTETTDEAESAGPEINNTYIDEQTENTEDKSAEEEETKEEPQEEDKSEAKGNKPVDQKSSHIWVVNAKGDRAECRNMYKKDLLYISIEDLMILEGLEYKGEVEGKKNRWTFDLADGPVIDVEVGSKYVWFSDRESAELKHETIMVDEVVYVPAIEFLNAYGYENAVVQGKKLYFVK